MTLYSPDTAPICEDCGEQMVERRRKVDGKRFYGCRNFPRCSNTEPIEAEDPTTYGQVYNGNGDNYFYP